MTSIGRDGASTLLDNAELERARELLAHQYAGAVHLMLAQRFATVSDLRAGLGKFHKESELRQRLDDLLAGRVTDKFAIHLLSDIAVVLGCEWRVTFALEQHSDDAPAAGLA